MPENPENRPKDFVADGSDSVSPDPTAWLELDEEQVDVNLQGINLARQALAGEVEAPQDISPTDINDITQPVLSEEVFPEPPDKPKRKTGKVAFGGFVKTELYDVFGDYDLSELTEEQKSWMSPEKLRAIILTPPQDAEFKVDNVPLNTYEYKLIVRSPKHLGKSAVAGVLHDNDIDDERVAASIRGEHKTLGKKQEKMQEHVAKLRDRREMIKSLTKEANNPGFAHKSPDEMKELLSAAWNEFTTMLDVAHVQRGWDDDKRSLAESALISYLTTGPQNQRVGNWQEMLKLSKLYLGTRITVFDNRIRKVNSRLK